jgi:hypothetical protein
MSIRLGHDLQSISPNVRPCLPARFRVLVWGVLGLCLLLLGYAAFAWIEGARVDNEANGVMASTASLESRQGILKVKVIALGKQEQVAKRLDAWTQLDTPMQVFLIDLLGSLDKDAVVSDLTVSRGTKSQYVVELSVLGPQEAAAGWFRGLVESMARKSGGYPQIDVEQRVFAGGVKLICTLGYSPRAQAAFK